MKKILAALLLICTVWGAGAQERKSMDNQTIDGYRGIWFTIGQARSGYGDKYSGGLGTYTMKHIPMAVYSPEADKTFFVYGGTPSEERKYLLCMVGCYDHKTGMLRRPVVVYDKGVAGVGDPHDDPTIQLDKEGYVWVFVAGRANKRPGIRYRSTKPYDISEFEYVNESIMAYPQVHYHPEKGFFLFFTRYDGVRRLFYQSSTDGIRWTDYRQIASIIDEGETKSGHYQFTNLCGDKLMCCFNRHINGNVDTRTNIYYIQSEDWGRTWTTIDGKPIELPITRSKNPALVHDYQSEHRNCYIKDINFGPDGQPVILYLTSDNHLTGPEGGVRKWQTVHWNGTEWVYSDITTSTHCYDSGSIWIDDDDVWTVIAPTDAGPQYWGTGGEMVMWRSRDKGQTWKRVRTLTHDSPRNHGYARRPLHADPDFYAFWADGNPDALSISYLYFCNAKGDVFRMPYTMNAEWQKPEPVPGGKPRD
ncbi:BNR-4 repeat-containing protein [Alistipes senegalensis]|uniref:BNR-4 repeat-containing protein n=1 Tax=Alistipes senegalensis TaxID=1288121 RepID=UPI00242C4065|nr:BNR-4 repeat-containing protein [Alistipes senegalensis]MCI7307575.1 BNR repeat-containing protein [Alistipes senegalensis]MDD7039720.1 BNR-4 repeat-containing protein [Alistipes senegalensis]MDY2877363.1 BNR-4 repeat-containing protein [Alistipes senegalensis]